MSVIAWFNPLKWIQWGLGFLHDALAKILGEKAVSVITNAIKVFLETQVGKLAADAVTIAEALFLGQPGQGDAKFNAAVAILKQDAGEAAAEIKKGNYDTFVQLAWQGLESNLEAVAKKYLADNFDKVSEIAKSLGVPVPLTPPEEVE